MTKSLMIQTTAKSLGGFEAVASYARKIGATHLHVATLAPRSRWQWERDLTDPYPNWGMSHIHVLKLWVPACLRPWLPWQEAEKYLAGLEERGRILEKYGLKLSLGMNEPFWLPEEVYQAHPHWRGPRIDHPRRARHPYFSPCIDQPEVLALYREAMGEICKLLPLDTVIFKSNDAGAGICWSTGLYTGQNGPAACAHRDMKTRILGFLSAFQEGARDVGKELVLDFNANLEYKENEHRLDDLWPFLPPGVFLNGRDNQGRPGKRVVRALTETNTSGVSPVREIPDVHRLAMKLCDAWQSDSRRIVFGLSSLEGPEARLLEKFLQGPPGDDVSAMMLVRETASELAGAERGGILSDLWYRIAQGFSDIEHLHLPFSEYGTVHQRWLTRPLVVSPARLTPEERDYYRKYQFQALSEEQANDLMDIQGLTFIRGFSGTFLATQSLEKAAGHFQQAVEKAERLLGDPAAPYSTELEALKIRLKAGICILRNAIHAAKFQEILDSVNPEQPPILSGNWPTPGDPRTASLQNLIRGEADNTQALIDLIRGREQSVLLLTPPGEAEDIFVIGADIVERLEQKIRIMYAHLPDIQEILETANI